MELLYSLLIAVLYSIVWMFHNLFNKPLWEGNEVRGLSEKEEKKTHFFSNEVIFL